MSALSLLAHALNLFVKWISSNLEKIVFFTIAVIIVFVAYKFLTKQIKRLKEQGKIEEHVTFILNRIFRCVLVLAILFVFLIQVGVSLEVRFGVGIIAGYLMALIIALIALLLIIALIALMMYWRKPNDTQ